MQSALAEHMKSLLLFTTLSCVSFGADGISVDPATVRRPTFKPFQNVHELRGEPTFENATHASHFVHWKHPEDDKREILFSYSVEKSNATIISLDKEEEVIFASCTHKSLVLHVNTSDSSGIERLMTKLANEDVFVTGGREWGCAEHYPLQEDGSNHDADGLRPILRKVLHAQKAAVSHDREINKTHEDGLGRVVLATRQADYTEIFRSAQIVAKFSTLPDDATSHVLKKPEVLREEKFMGAGPRVFLQSEKEDSPRRRHHFFRKIWHKVTHAVSHVWKKIKTFGEDVGKVIKGITKIIVLIFTGKLDCEKTLTMGLLSWNYDAASGKAHNTNMQLDGDNIVCTNCFASLDASLNFVLHIEDYRLNELQMYAEGSFHGNVAITGQYTTDFDYGKEMLLGTTDFKTITFVVLDIPFTLSPILTMKAGFAFNATVEGKVEVGGFIKGDVKYGVAYEPDTGMQTINEKQLDFGGTFTEHLGVQATGSVYLAPILLFDIDHIGGPNVGLKPEIEVSIAVDEDDSVSSASVVLHESVNIALAVSLGASIHIFIKDRDIYNHQFGPWTILSHKFPILSKAQNIGWIDETIAQQMVGETLSDHLGNSSLIIARDVSASDWIPAPTDVFTGPVFIDRSTLECALYPDMDMTIQFIGIDNTTDNMQWIASVNSLYTFESSLFIFNQGCVFQQSYISPNIMDYLGNDTIEFSLDAVGNPDVDVTNFCTDASAYPPIVEGVAVINIEMTEILIESILDPCIEAVTLFRGPPNLS